jgi:hypothetical protein
MEISFNIETEVFAVLSLTWFTLPSVSIDEIELLVLSSMSLPGVKVSVFSVNTSLNIHNLLVVFVDKVW